MKQKSLIPGLAAAGGIAAFALRLAQNKTGFEEDTGLAIPGHFAGRALPVLFLLLAAALFLLTRKLPKTVESASFPAAFPVGEATELMLPVMGVFLMAISGGLEAAMGLGLFPGALFDPRRHLLLGAFAIVSAAGLFFGIVACRRCQEDFKPAALLPVSVMLVVRLVLTYRTSSTDPALAAYYVELLAIVFLTLAFFHLAGFAFGDAHPRRFTFSAAMAVVFALAAAAELGKLALPALALYVGGGLVVLGFLMVYLGKDE